MAQKVQLQLYPVYLSSLFIGDHPKTAEAIARKINLILGDTKETLAQKTGRPIEEIYEDELESNPRAAYDLSKIDYEITRDC